MNISLRQPEDHDQLHRLIRTTAVAANWNTLPSPKK
ncbi:hypothetical protein MNBD_PLANCTO03-259, partial [hydrothermal vent metagenome]